MEQVVEGLCRNIVFMTDVLIVTIRFRFPQYLDDYNTPCAKLHAISVVVFNIFRGSKLLAMN